MRGGVGRIALVLIGDRERKLPTSQIIFHQVFMYLFFRRALTLSRGTTAGVKVAPTSTAVNRGESAIDFLIKFSEAG